MSPIHIKPLKHFVLTTHDIINSLQLYKLQSYTVFAISTSKLLTREITVKPTKKVNEAISVVHRME
jgi:hypothetical protein